MLDPLNAGRFAVNDFQSQNAVAFLNPVRELMIRQHVADFEDQFFAGISAGVLIVWLVVLLQNKRVTRREKPVVLSEFEGLYSIFYSLEEDRPGFKGVDQVI